LPAIRAGLFGGSVKAALALVLISPLVGLLAGPLAAPVQAGSVAVVSHGDRAEHEIALTFDDGVSPANCRRILAILVERKVPATFFPLAEAMRLDPSFWQLVGQAGYPVGNHSLTHPLMPDLDPSAQVQQIETARVLEESILGRSTIDVFRPPYGAYDATTLSAAAQAGYSTVLTWSDSDRDTSPTGHEPAMLAAGELGGNGSVILLHCGPNATPYLLGPLIEFYRARGYRFVTIPQMLGIAWNPGRTSAISPGQILHGLSPLPATSSGGPITGPNGWTPPSGVALAPTPSPARSSATSRSPTPARSPAASRSPVESASAGSPSLGAPAASPRPAPPAPAGAKPAEPRRVALAGLLVVALLGLGSLSGALVLVVRSHRLP
jgi:peptidoglycan/xylan/chitin deacetylase (PgdA/CDA1 family)